MRCVRPCTSHQLIYTKHVRAFVVSANKRPYTTKMPSKSTLIKDLVQKNSAVNKAPGDKPPDEAAVDEVLSDLGQEGGAPPYPSHMVSPQIQEQLHAQQQLQEQIIYQQDLINQRDQEIAMRYMNNSNGVANVNSVNNAVNAVNGVNDVNDVNDVNNGGGNGAKTSIGRVTDMVTSLFGAVFRLDTRLVLVAAALYLLFQYVNITIVLNAVMRATRMREFPDTGFDNQGAVVQMARSVVFGTLVSLSDSLVSRVV